jgi:Glycosyl hydrolase family 20, domain 2
LKTHDRKEQSFLSLATAIHAAETTELKPAIIPYPLKLEIHPGEFKLTDKSRILVDASTRATGEYLSEILADITGTKMLVVEAPADAIFRAYCLERSIAFGE